MNPEEKTLVILSLGTNLGDRKGNLESVLALLPPMVEVLQSSSIYSTEPWGYPDQPDFLNQVLLAETELDPFELLSYLKEIEKEVGREPTFRYGPRMADIDIILYGNQIIDSEELQVPHPRFQERSFVLVPLAEIAPDLQVPGTNRTIADLLEDADQAGVELYQDRTP